jgi:hypothetical protein
MPKGTIIEEIAHAIVALRNCEHSGNVEWAHKHRERLEKLRKNFLPSGSGIDRGTKIDVTRSTDDRIVFTASYHHMDEHGMYSHWTDHTITVQASFIYGFTLTISGKDYNDIKEYLRDTFRSALEAPCPI